MSKITAQLILQELKALEGSLSAISRTNKPLHFQVRKRLNDLQSRIISSCDNIVFTNDEYFVGTKRLERLIAESSTGESADASVILDNLQYLVEEANGELARKEAEIKQQEAQQTAANIKAATTGEGDEPTIEIKPASKEDVEFEDDTELLNTLFKVTGDEATESGDVNPTATNPMAELMTKPKSTD